MIIWYRWDKNTDVVEPWPFQKNARRSPRQEKMYWQQMRWVNRALGDIESKRVGLHKEHGLRVSTIFLSLDHSFFGGPPVLFELMVFPGEDSFEDLLQARFSSPAEARRAHAQTVQALKFCARTPAVSRRKTVKILEHILYEEHHVRSHTHSRKRDKRSSEEQRF